MTGSGAISKWQYQQKTDGNFGDWQDISSTSTSLSYTVTGLTDATNYQFKVRAKNATGEGAASDASTATCTSRRNADRNQHQCNGERRSPSVTTAAIGTTSTRHRAVETAPAPRSLAPRLYSPGLSSNTSYTYKAYSDSSCSTELAAASAFLTKPGKPTTPTVAAGTGSGKLTLSASVTGSGTLTGWQYQQKTDGNFGDWQDISSTSTTLSYTVTGLTDATSYQFKVRAKNATDFGAASDASTATATSRRNADDSGTRNRQHQGHTHHRQLQRRLVL